MTRERCVTQELHPCAGCGGADVFGVFCPGCMGIISRYGPWWLHRKIARGNETNRAEGIAEAIEVIQAAKGIAPTLPLEVARG